MKKTSAVYTLVLLLILPVVLFADKLPKVAYFSIPKGRVIVSQKAINKLSNGKGVVAINFVISKQGKVLSAQVDDTHTTVQDKAFINKVVKAVLAVKFNTYWAGPDTQSGSLAYVFN